MLGHIYFCAFLATPLKQRSYSTKHTTNDVSHHQLLLYCHIIAVEDLGPIAFTKIVIRDASEVASTRPAAADHQQCRTSEEKGVS